MIAIGKEILKQGYALLQKDRLDEADAVYARMPSDDPDFYQALRYRGIIATMQRQLQRAILLFTQAIAISDDGESHYQLATVHFALQAFGLAFIHYKHALRIAPHDMNARIGVEVTTARLPPTAHWCRTVMYQEGHKLIKSLGPGLDVLEVAGTYWNDPTFKFNSYLSTSFEEYDSTRGPFPSKEWLAGAFPPPGNFDLVILDQVLERARHPMTALSNAVASLKAIGPRACFVSTPFLIRNHPAPTDFWRFTESGLRCLLEDAGFPSSKIQSGSWGNRACVVANFERWEIYDYDTHSLKNEKDYPVTVWALARL